ncbi:MAG: polysaccharide deacetylase family protein [Candidatus Symbiothrix sp.]|jgi:hypothetical protein|nr:polysaccharide deacetylase family protein [Candidatus Symbiothrix sp.]
MVSIYAPFEKTKRLHYIANQVFKQILLDDFELIGEKAVFLQKPGFCINYSGEDLQHGLWIKPQGLLSETGVREIEDLKESEWQGFFCFFRQDAGDIPFDVFSAAFYLLTLYEEYYIKKYDEHGRFDLQSALTYRKQILAIPVIDRWVYLLKEKLEALNPGMTFQTRKYKFVSTFDIDHPYLYLKKGLIKTAGGSIRDVLRFNFKNIFLRFSVHLRLHPDPYMASIRWIAEVHKNAGVAYHLFVLVGGRGKYGRTTVYPTKSYYKYLKNLEGVAIGLHPSYFTYLNLRLLIREKKRLEAVLGRSVTTSRQHYLRMRSPETFQELAIAGFADDYTLAFAHAAGFRSGTAIPYYFYDIEKEETSHLLLHPTVMMDSTLISHLRLSPEEALHKIKQLTDECKKSGGDYVSLWHNSNISGDRLENPWIDVFTESFRDAAT